MWESFDYASVRKPLLEASTLPVHCYTDSAFFSVEVERIFTPAWHFVGRLDELENTGDFLVVDTVVGSALVCRDQEGRCRAYINSCRHRGTRLKNVSGRCASFVCPYHAWTYGHDGQLRSAPGMDAQNFDLGDFSLAPVRLNTWGGFVFICFDPKAPTLVDWLGDLPERMACYDPQNLVCTGRIDFTVNANWKFLIENALEAYHTGTVHRETLGAQRSASVETRGQWDALYVFSSESKSIATLPGESQTFPFIRSLNDAGKKGTWFTVIYPCTQLVFSQDCAWWLDIKPISVNKSSVVIGGCFPVETTQLERFEQGAKAYYHRWKAATEEDNAIAENQQQGHNAGFTSQGRFASTEHCVHALDNWVLDQILGGHNPGEHGR